MSNIQPDTIETERILRLKEGFLIERIDGEISVYHPTLTTAIYLNETGALIWELCDGRRSVGDIIDVLGDHYPESRLEIETDIKLIIAQLVDHGIGELI